MATFNPAQKSGTKYADLKKRLLFLLGALLQRTLINRVLDALPQNQILLTIGIGLVLSNVAMLVFTSDYRILSTSYSSSSVGLGIIRLSTPLLYCFLITAVITASALAPAEISVAICWGC